MATKLITLELDENLLAEIDLVVKNGPGSRSEYFHRLAIADLERRAHWNQLMNSGNGVGRKMGITNEQQVYDMLDEPKA